jgi:hypothetical protein
MPRFVLLPALCALTLVLGCSSLKAAEITVLSPDNWDAFAPAGKEADAVYGDWVLRNAQWTAVIAQPLATRNANMTVRNVGGCVIDFTTRAEPNDQLSCYYPGGGRIGFIDAKKVRVLVDGTAMQIGTSAVSGKTIIWEYTDPRMTLRYTAADDRPNLLVETIYHNPGDAPLVVEIADGIRADRTFTIVSDEKGNLFSAADDWFRQAYGVRTGEAPLSLQMRGALAFPADVAKFELIPGASRTIARRLFCADSQLALFGLAAADLGQKVATLSVKVAHPQGAAEQAKLTLLQGDKIIATARTGASGEWSGPVPQGEYELVVDYLGHPPVKTAVDLTGDVRESILLREIGSVRLEVVDAEDRPLPCKVAFFGRDETPDPQFAPDSGEVAVGNLHYSHTGEFTQPLLAGKYEALVSHGPEYDAVNVEFEVTPGQTTTAAAKIKRVVDTKGWISADFHNHASPSGDNTASQYGRVLNLLCENIEFAPCTEHNRVDSYLPHLERMKATHLMATCTGIELTGSPLPVNHQNAFPIEHLPRTQDGGGPTTETDPVEQIAKLSMWNGGADKLLQMNHPNLPQILGDKDLDGSVDAGFEKMFAFTDVIEIHPIQSIFNPPGKDFDFRKDRNPAFAWMQMLNQGYRIPGVVNTDAHYNFHGSGWMRNFIRCSTDDPAKITTPEMIKSSEAGHVVMSTGPFLSVEMTTEATKKPVIPGDDLSAPNGQAELFIRVQCPNWLDVNRVQVFLNGRADEKLNFTRRAGSPQFGNEVVKFEARLPLKLERDTHVVVAAIGEGLTLGRVFGPNYGKLPPVALANPIFVDVDGDGFSPNGDLLDVPLQFDREAAQSGKLTPVKK